MKRENGYYWVIFASEKVYRIALFENGFWYWMGTKWSEETHPFSVIKEEKLKPPTLKEG